MRGRPSAVLLGMLIVVTAVASLLFWLIAGAITEQSSRSQIEDLLDRAEQEAISTIEESAADIDRTARVLAQLADGGLFERGVDSAMFQTLEFVPELSGVFLAQESGSFHFVYRTETGYGTKRILTARNDAEQRRVIFSDRDERFVELERWIDPEDDYDPTQRPWFSAARATPGEPTWTSPYIFFTSQQPGITRALSADDGSWVVGVDVQLQGLVELLDRLSSEVSGDVFLHDGTNLALTKSGLVEWGDPTSEASERVGAILAAVGELGEIRGDRDVTIRIDDTNHTARQSPLEALQGGWKLVVDVSDDDVPVPISGLVRNLELLALAVGGFAVLTFALLMIPATKPIRRLHRDATTDALTGLANRRAIWQRGELLAEACTPFAVMMVDADGFKEINDVRGHLVGDEVLRGLAQRLEHERCDTGRVGGEEFLVLHRETTDEDHLEVAERIRRAVAAEPIVTAAGPIAVTVSIGLAEHELGEPLSAVVERADGALLEAKLNGKNRVNVASSTPSDLLAL